jgi:hypothetical protein
MSSAPPPPLGHPPGAMVSHCLDERQKRIFPESFWKSNCGMGNPTHFEGHSAAIEILLFDEKIL